MRRAGLPLVFWDVIWFARVRTVPLASRVLTRLQNITQFDFRLAPDETGIPPVTISVRPCLSEVRQGSLGSARCFELTPQLYFL